MINYLKKKIKDFIHSFQVLEKMTFSIWSIFRIIKARFFFRKIKHSSLKKNFKIIVLGVRRIPTTDLVYFDAIFGHAFKMAGADVKMLYCDGVLDSCDADTVFRNQKTVCFACNKFGKSLEKSLKLECLSFRSYVSDSDVEEIKDIVKNLKPNEMINYHYLNVNVGKHAHASAIRYFLSGKLDLNDSQQIKILRNKLVYAMVNTKVAEVLVKKENPDCVFTLHGNYSTWGPFFSYFRFKGLDAVINSHMPPRYGCFLFNRNSKANTLSSEKIWAELSQLPIKEEERKRVDNYLNKRIKGLTQDHKMYKDCFKKEKEKNLFLKLLLESKNKYSKNFVMYPNLAWDAAIEGGISDIFKDVFDWIDKTVEFFKKKPDYQLIIRTHPAELVWDECNQSIDEYITKKYSPLPDNIILLKPNAPLMAYDLIDENTVAILYNGTLGCELAPLGIPVLTAADDVHYKKAGVVYKVRDLEDYLSILYNPDPLIQFAKNNIDLTKKYADFYFFKSLIRIPFYSDKKWAIIDWSRFRDTNKLFNSESNIMKICNKIINKQDVVLTYEESKNNY